MALGILEPRAEHVPGTVQVTRQSDNELSKSRTTILVPKPTDDPNDPLTWPIWQRDIILVILCIVSVLATTASPLLAADSVELALKFQCTFEDAALLTAYHLAGVAVGSLLFVPLARVWGKRHVFLIGSLLMIASSAWGGSTHMGYNYTSMLWARVIQGVALAPFESLINACVGDLYFVHERGLRMAFANVSLFGGAFLTPVFVGMIAHNIGWWWSFYFIAIFMGGGFLLLLFLCPEVAYRRPDRLNTDIMTASSESLDPNNILYDEKSPNEQVVPRVRGNAWKPLRISPFDGRKTDESFWKLFLRPFPLFLHPAVIWACLLQGVIIGWTVMVGVILSLIFLGPPLFYNEEQAGKMYTAAFIGSILGLLIAGVYTELTTRFMVRRNNGRYEPEFRILLVIPTLMFAASGLYGFGITAAKVARYGWFVPEVFLALIVASMVMGATASAQYLLDAHRDIAIESFTCLIIFKNIFSFILAYFAYTWVFSGGIERLFIIFGSIEVAICALSLPMYVFGKISRDFFHRHDLLQVFRLR
ncbi:serine/threonine kinase 16, partial [Aureobasidium melanogenum]